MPNNDKIVCSKCKKSVSKRGLWMHEKHCKGAKPQSEETIKKARTKKKIPKKQKPKAEEPKPTEKTEEIKPEEPKTEVKTEPKPQAEETIQITQDFINVPKLHIEEPVQEKTDNKQDVEKPTITETQPTGDKIDVSGICEMAISIINPRFKKNNVDELTPVEQNNIIKSFNEVINKRIDLYFKYADIINLSFALALPLMVRAPQIKRAKAQNQKEKPTEEQPNVQIEEPKQEQNTDSAFEQSQKRFIKMQQEMQ